MKMINEFLKALKGNIAARKIIKEEFGTNYYNAIKEVYKQLSDIEKKRIEKICIMNLHQLSVKMFSLTESIDENLRVYIYMIGIKEFSHITNLQYNDVNSWLNGKRYWTYNKIQDLLMKVMSDITMKSEPNDLDVE